jgi:hypothetical protein
MKTRTGTSFEALQSPFGGRIGKEGRTRNVTIIAADLCQVKRLAVADAARRRLRVTLRVATKRVASHGTTCLFLPTYSFVKTARRETVRFYR